MAKGSVRVKRVYEEPAPGDGLRVLIDRLWPRGLSKERAEVSMWLKEAAPSTELRKWFDHDPDRWEEFKRRYLVELAKGNALNTLLDLVERRRRQIADAAVNLFIEKGFHKTTTRQIAKAAARLNSFHPAAEMQPRLVVSPR